MKFGVAIAICISFGVVGFAAWHRFFAPQTVTNIAAIQPVTKDSSYDDELLRDFLESDKSGAIAIPEQEENLTNTDVVSRNLILSYLNLANSGNVVNAQSIENLATQYANNITSYHVYTKAMVQDITVVPDSFTTAQNYSDKLMRVYADYANSVQNISNNVTSLGESGDSYKPFLESLLVIYEGLANGFKAVPVPVSLSQLHLELINGYLSNAQAMRSAKNLETDPITAMAGLTSLKDTSGREVEILNAIRKILQNKWGII